MSDDRWYFSKDRLENSPSRKCGIDADKELNYKQLAANLIHDMGSRKHLSVNQLCISTAMVYMHRFYVFHSFTHFQWNAIAMASLFLAAKVEEQTRKLEHVIKVAQWCLQKSQSNIDCNSEAYLQQVQELVMNENILLQTLGFDVAVKHPHSFIVEFSDKIKMNRDITKTMYGMASNSLHVTTMCVQYKPSVVACFCVHFVCKWSNHAIHLNSENKEWWSLIDPSVTPELLEQMTNEFLAAFEKSPVKLKNKVQELLRNRHISSNHPLNGDRSKSEVSDLSSSGSFCHDALTTPPASISNLSKHPSVMSDRTISGPNGMHKLSTTHISNHHHHGSHSATKVSTSSTSINGHVNSISNVTTAPSQLCTSNSIPHISSSSLSSSASHQQRHLLYQQYNHHRHHAAPVPISQHAHKTSINDVHNIAKSKINPVTISHSTVNCSAGVTSTKDMRPDRRKVAEIRLKPGPGLKPESTNRSVTPIVTSVAVHQRTNMIVDAIVKNTLPKNDCSSREFNSFASSSNSNIISDVIKEVAMAQQYDRRIDVTTEPPENNSIPLNITDTSSSISNHVLFSRRSKNHSIFSPSPPLSHCQNESFSIESRIPSNEVLIKQEILPSNILIKKEPLPEKEPIKQEFFSVGAQIKQEFSPTYVQIKQESFAVTPPKPANVQYNASISHSEPITIANTNEIMSCYGNVLSKNLEQAVNIPESTSTVSSTPFLNVKEKEKACEIKTEADDSTAFSSVISQPTFLLDSAEDLGVGEDKVINVSAASECSSVSCTHKKKKKYKEKDKHHKEKKRHKEEKNHNSKEYHSKEKERKEPEPIKITIPKEKLTDIPVKLKIKISKDLIVKSSISKAATNSDVREKVSSEKASKSHKRKRELDHDHSLKKRFCDIDKNSRNGLKE